ncbi:MAG: pilus assembly protein PilB [Spartobacteria bacterium]|nr:pilus assembly protein PilB [Spartobacteria bacterium]
MAEYSDMFLEELVRNGLIDDGQAAEVVDEHERTGKPTKDVALEMGLLTEEQGLDLISKLMGAERVDLEHMSVPMETLQAVPGSVARMYNAMPVAADAGSVTLAVANLVGPETSDEIRFVLSKDVQFMVASNTEIANAISRYYGSEDESMKDMLSSLEGELADAGELLESGARADDIASVEAAANSRPVVRFVNLVIYQAVQDRASDIHFEPFENEFKIRYRVDGALYEMAPPPRHLALPVTSRLKVISGLNIAERRVPQDGRIQLPVGGRMIDFRVSTLPTQFGESVVLRVLDRSVVSLDLENIGMPDDVYQYFCEDIDKPNGIVVVTGPTGSGKTTTLYSALRRLNTIENKLLTAEEPVEYDIDGIVQVPIHEAIGVTFGKVLRAFLRQDPDIIMVGEIRDIETSEIAIQASLTGHLVFSTLHTNDAAGAVTRLIDMGVEPFLIASTLEAVLGQRLVRTICSNCKTEYQPTSDLIQQLGMTEQQVGGRPFFYGAGCSYCNQTGYKGRRGIYEYLRIKDPVRDLINQRKPTLVIRDKAVELGMRTLREDGIRCILDGYTTVEEVLKYT